MIGFAFNVGSSSLKVVARESDPPRVLRSVEVSGLGGTMASLAVDGSAAPCGSDMDHHAAFELSARHLSGITPGFVAHRIVHGGARRSPAGLDDAVLTELDAWSSLAPLHQPAALAVARACRARWPDIAHVAVFDTAFHQTMPEEAVIMPLPERWRLLGVRRYGFHGIACEDVVAQLGAKLKRRAVVMHLGSGCSVTALEGGRSVGTTMGFTPTGGVVMGSRPGDIDPACVLHLQRAGVPIDELARELSAGSGLRGLAGTSDMRELVRRRDEPAVAIALAVFCRSSAMAAAAAAVALGGVDQIVFSGGIGENAAWIRERILDRIRFLGVQANGAANERNAEVITTADSAIECRIVRVDEGRAMIAAAVGLG